MRLDPAEARDRFVSSPVLRLATVGADARPHVVPCTFAVDGAGRVVIGIDSKPKVSANVRRLRNIGENPRVSMLVDHYAGDWAQLWWVRADGVAVVERSGAEFEEHWELLRARYPQYGEILGGQDLGNQILDGPVIAVTVDSWTGWAFA
jgi:PPOX class probable F420-dependent enzyme